MRLPNQRVVIALLLATLLVASGCLRLGSSGGATSTATATTAQTDTTSTPRVVTVVKEATTEQNRVTPEQIGTETTDGIDMQTDDETYQFSEGERYEYDIRSGTQTVPISWQVETRTDDTLVVELTVGSQDSTKTLSGSRTEVLEQARETTVGSVLVPMLELRRRATDDHSLTVGNSWTSESTDASEDWNVETVTVSGTDSYAGVECHVIQITRDGEHHASACINEDYPFAFALTTTDDTGKEVAVKLTGVSR